MLKCLSRTTLGSDGHYRIAIAANRATMQPLTNKNAGSIVTPVQPPTNKGASCTAHFSRVEMLVAQGRMLPFFVSVVQPQAW